MPAATSFVQASAGVVASAVGDVARHASRGTEAVRVLLGSLSAIIGKLAELRNLYGTGHGKQPSTRGLHPRHARLAVGAAGTLSTFLFETHIAKPSKADT